MTIEDFRMARKSDIATLCAALGQPCYFVDEQFDVGIHDNSRIVWYAWVQGEFTLSDISSDGRIFRYYRVGTEPTQRRGATVTIAGYGKDQGATAGRNALLVVLGDTLSIYFSYRTPIAFRTARGLVVRVNDWSNTTGKHLNWVDGGDKDSRISGAEFVKRLESAMVDFGYVCNLIGAQCSTKENE